MLLTRQFHSDAPLRCAPVNCDVKWKTSFSSLIECCRSLFVGIPATEQGACKEGGFFRRQGKADAAGLVGGRLVRGIEYQPLSAKRLLRHRIGNFPGCWHQVGPFKNEIKLCGLEWLFSARNPSSRLCAIF